MAESAPGSITEWVGDLRKGDGDAARKLWERYFASVVRIAAGKIQGAPRGVADEEDVALSVFQSLCQRAAAGKLPAIDDRHDLWRVLMVLSRQKAIDHRRTQGRQKRGGGVINAGSAANDNSNPAMLLDQFLGPGPQPEEIAAIREELGILLQVLPEDAMRAIAVGKLEGRTNDELAEQLGVVPRTVERKLQLIRHWWLQRLPSEVR